MFRSPVLALLGHSNVTYYLSTFNIVAKSEQNELRFVRIARQVIKIVSVIFILSKLSKLEKFMRRLTYNPLQIRFFPHPLHPPASRFAICESRNERAKSAIHWCKMCAESDIPSSNTLF